MPERFLASVLPQHEAAELYRLMVVGIREVAVFLMDPNGFITVWNQAAQDMKGYTADEAIGQHLGMLYTDDDREAGHPQKNLERAAAHGVFSEETWRKRKDGRLFWARIVLTALRNSDNELVGFSKITMDLTHHRKLEQCEKEKEEIDMILNAAEAGTWKWDVAAGTVEVSRQLRQLLGYEDDVRVAPVEQWLDFVHPEERPALRMRLQAARESIEAAPFEMELRLQSAQGDAQWFFLRANWHRIEEQGPLVFFGACVRITSLKQAEEEQARLLAQLKQERARFANILEQMPSGVILAEAPGGKLTYQNRAAAALLGRGLDNVNSYNDYDSYNFVDINGHRINVADLPLTRTLVEHAPPHTQELLYQRPEGGQSHFAITTAAIHDNDGVARLAIAVLHDVSGLKLAEHTAATEKERALVTLAAITDGVMTADRHGAITSMNPAAERLTGVEQEQARGQQFSDVLHVEDDPNGETLFGAIDRCLEEGRVLSNLPHVTLRSRDAERYSVEAAVAPVMLADGESIGAVVIFHDVTESKRLLRRLGHEASHDALTGLVNRREFEVRLKRALERTRHGGPGNTDGAALLYMDLDQFKVVNDTCGHPAGDDLLKMLARSYSEHVRERDTLARIGGDEFALIVEHCDVDEALAVAHKILEATRNFRYACKGRVFQLGVSIGVTPIDADTASVEEAMRRADHACYIAKDRGRNRVYVHYRGDLDFAQRRSDMHWVTRLTHAFQNEQLQLYYQPIVALGDVESPQHYEILLRLRNGRAGPIAPGTFLPAAERYDVIVKIDRWVLMRTLEWLASEPEHTEQLKMCSINLSRRSLADPAFLNYATELIDASAIPADKLCFEITEHGAIADMQKTIAFMEALSQRGCRFSLDDFGTGMTSFSYLKQLPVDYIKIDGSFVQMMSSSEVDYEMVRFTNDISHMMGRQTIAEYVTDAHILASLKNIGVDFAQGYWVGKPRPLTP